MKYFTSFANSEMGISSVRMLTKTAAKKAKLEFFRKGCSTG
jgi:hypothetical protein